VGREGLPVIALVGVAMLLFVGVCSAVGVRLLWLAKAGGGRPALLCGNGFCLIAILGFPLGVLSGHGLVPVAQVQLPLVAISLLANLLGIACFFVFTVNVFRPTALWAHALAGGAIACTAMACVAILSALAVAPGSASSFAVTWGWSATFQALCALCFFWMGCEGLREWRRSRRRQALGLSDPVVCHRLLMWGVFGLSTTLLCGVLLAVQLSGQPTPTSLVAQLAQALFGIVSSGAAALAFFPPRAYLVRVRGGARGLAA
jgi:hypothetical protein